MSLLWAVPAVAVTVAVALVLARARAIEEICGDLVVAVRRTRELRVPLTDIQRELRRSGPLVERVWSHWDTPEPPDDADDGTGDESAENQR